MFYNPNYRNYINTILQKLRNIMNNKEGNNKKSGARPTSSRPSSNKPKPAMQKKAQGPKKVK
jgi:hypothetical protein